MNSILFENLLKEGKYTRVDIDELMRHEYSDLYPVLIDDRIGRERRDPEQKQVRREKPSQEELQQINTDIVKNQKDRTLAELIQGISQGCTFVNKCTQRRNSHFTASRLMTLDFDGLTSIDDFIQTEYELGLQSSIIYPTYSHTKEEHKFRVIYLLREPITDGEIYRQYMTALISLFKGADPACKEPVRLFHGTKFEVYINGDYENFTTKYLDTEILASAIRAQEKAKDKITYARNMKKEYAVFYEEKGQREYKINNPDWHRLENLCDLYKDFVKGDEALYYNQLFHLALGMRVVKGGDKKFKDTILSRSELYTNAKHEPPYYIAISSSISNRAEYNKGSRCSSLNCPYFEECPNNDGNIIRLFRKDAKPYRYQEKDLKETLEKGREKMEEQNREIQLMHEHGMYFLKAPTGVGKTELYIDERYESQTMILFPNHRLKTDVYERILAKKKYGWSEVCVIPPKPKVKDDDIRKQIKALRDMGFTDRASTMENNYIKLQAYHGDKICQDYLNWIEFADTAPLVLTTHERGLLNQFPHIKNVIIDEDILKKTLDGRTTTINDIVIFRNIVKETKNKANLKLLDDLLEKLRSQQALLSDDEPTKFSQPFYIGNIGILNTESISTRLLTARTMPASDVLSMFAANNAIINKLGQIMYISRRELEVQYRKYTIYSATIEETFTRLVFEHHVKAFKDCGNIENTGKVIQFIDNSYSKTWMRKNFESALSTILTEIEKRGKKKDDYVLISHNIYTNKFKEAGFIVDKELHFGNAEGIDIYKGRNLIVAGLYNLPFHYYDLLFAELGFTDPEASARSYIRVEKNGLSYMLYTYHNSVLRDIHMYYIQNELTQAIGRARIREHDCEVLVFAGMPSEETDELWYDDSLI
jgi:hypothetical protein